MSRIGYYRIKIKPSEADTIVNLYNKESLYASALVKAKSYKGTCTDDEKDGVYVKYLDQYGRYRFWMFNDKWKETLRTREIGTKSKIINTLRSDQSSLRHLGFKSSRFMSLKSEKVTREEREILSEIFVSPRVYVRRGTGDELSDWLLCSEIRGDNVINDMSVNSSRFEINIRLPDYYSITDV